MDKKQQVNVWYVLLAMLALLFFQSWWIEQSKVETLPYSQFEKLLQEGGIAEMSVGTNVIEGKLKQPIDPRRVPHGHRRSRPGRSVPQVRRQVLRGGAQHVVARSAVVDRAR